MAFRIKQNAISYWSVFRLVFVVFYFYLLGDAFYRWDGFSYYASFSEFLPSVALVTILWVIVAVFTSITLWLTLRGFEWFRLRIGLKIKIEHLLIFTGIFVLLGVLIWIYRNHLWDIIYIHSWLLFSSVTIIALLITWLFRNKAERVLSIINKRITPLVWLFSIWVILSCPLVVYHTWLKPVDKVSVQSVFQPTMADKYRPNIVLVTFDALTARDMSVYGYHRPTTPFITKWAGEASLFTNAQSASNSTTPSTASIMTGKRVWTHQACHVEAGSPLKSDKESLPLLLKMNGYYNMAFIANPKASAKKLGITNGFEVAPNYTAFSVPASLFALLDKGLYRLFDDRIRLHDWIIKEDFVLHRVVAIISRNLHKTIVPPENAFNRFLSVLDDNPREPFFAWIHLLPPHDPYLPPEPYMGMFDSSSELRTLKSQRKLYHYQHYPQEMQPIINKMRGRYDEFIRYCDKQFEDFITQLRIRDKLKNTIIILSSDHGESFEHNYYRHGGPHLYEPLVHVPLIIKEPNQTEGLVIKSSVRHIDIPPTILDFAYIPIPSWMDGRSLVPLTRGKYLSSQPLFSTTLEHNRVGHEITSGTIAVWKGDYKLIHYLDEKESLLFNLRADPDETRNIYDEQPEIGQGLLKLINVELSKANERIAQSKESS